MMHLRYQRILGTMQLAGLKEIDAEHAEILEKAFIGMLKPLYTEQSATMRIDIINEPEVQALIDSHAGILNSAMADVNMSDSMRTHLEKSNWVFSGMKTFHELNEAFPKLIDDNGNRKTFQQFSKDVLAIDKTYNRNYLRAEFNFVQASADMAAKWERFAQDGERYDLQYRTAGDGLVRPEHAALDGITMPMDDPFWNEYYPPNGWNCRCTVVQVLKDKYPETQHDDAMSLGEKATADDKKGMFRFNPGMQQRTVPAYNPYTISKCKNCKFGKNIKLAAGGISGSQLCAACEIVRNKQANRINKRPTTSEFASLTKKAKDWANSNLDAIDIGGNPSRRTMVKSSDGHNIGVGTTFFTETAHKNKNNPLLPDVMEAAMDFKQWIKMAGKPKIENGKDHAYQFSVYEVQWKSHQIQFKCKLTDGELLYTMRFI